MNIYQFHSDPKSLKHYNETQKSVPSIFAPAVEYGATFPKNLSTKQIAAIKTSPMHAFHYAYRHLDRRWPEAEPYIMKSPEWAFKYSSEIIGGRWKEAESYIMKDAAYGKKYLSIYNLAEIGDGTLIEKRTINELGMFLVHRHGSLWHTAVTDLQNAFPRQDVKVFKAIFYDYEKEMMGKLKVDSLKIGKATFESAITTRWSSSKNAVTKMAEEHVSETRENYVIIEAKILANDVVLDTTKLTDGQLLALCDNSEQLARMIKEQKEIIIAPGTYFCHIVYS